MSIVFLSCSAAFFQINVIWKFGTLKRYILYVYKFNTYTDLVKQMSYLMLSVVLYLITYCNWKYVSIISAVLEIIFITFNLIYGIFITMKPFSIQFTNKYNWLICLIWNAGIEISIKNWTGVFFTYLVNKISFFSNTFSFQCENVL